jgi:hypothetical protein
MALSVTWPCARNFDDILSFSPNSQKRKSFRTAPKSGNDPRRTSATGSACSFRERDFCSHNMGLDDAGASILLSPIVAVLFLAGRGGRLLLLPFYWLTVVLISAAGTAVADFISGRNMLGLPVSTAVTGALFIALLVIWREQSRSERDRHRFLMRSALRHSAPRGRGAAHGAVPRGRVTTRDGGGHDEAGMRRAQKHMSRSGRRSK